MANGLIQLMPDQDQELVRRLALRWLRAADPHHKWAKKAKECVNFLEGEQWTEEQMAELRELRRTALTINKIAPLFRLIMGYQSSNRMDVTYLPTSDSQSNEDIATILNNLFKSEANRADLKYIDTEVFADGLSTGRGWWDFRLCFKENDFGLWKPRCIDPFTLFIDPDANTYDIEDSAGYVQESVWTDLDKINSLYGSEAAEACQLISSETYHSTLSAMGEDDISPARFFGEYTDNKAMKNWADVYHTDFVDRQAKRYRLIDSQYKVTTIAPCFIDLETGDRQIIPEEWMKPENQHKIQKSLDYAERIGNPLKVARRPIERIRWSVTCADVLLHDGWSPYDHYTQVGYFPYFRRGKTRGMIHDLIDPQKERNKKRSVLTDILNRNANSGWIYEENTLDPEQEENLKVYGSSPGVHVKWKRNGQTSERPQRLEPGGYPQGLDRLEEKSSDDMNDISGVNESALGQLDRVQSGRAIEARQRQAVLAIQMYSDNFSRSKKIQGRNTLSLFQKHYTETRIFRVMGEDSKLVQYEINKKQVLGDNSVQRMNDITVGKYMVTVDEVPISATFKQGQFEETMTILEKLGPVGAFLVQANPSLLVDQTSLPRKPEWVEAIKQASQMAQQAEAAAAGAPPPGGGAPVMQQPTPEQVTG